MNELTKKMLKIAGMIIILSLVLIFVTLYVFDASTNATWPPESNQCPDYWTVEKNLGNEGYSCVDYNDLSGLGTTDENGNLSPYTVDIDTAEKSSWISLCNKKSWADGLNLTWDGVTNTNTDCVSYSGSGDPSCPTCNVYSILSS